MAFSCFKCGTELTGLVVQGRLSFKETCPKCSSDAHVCLNCLHYDEIAYHECREPQAEWVRDKEDGNICEYFRPKGGGGPAKDVRSETMSKLDDLFKK